MTWLAFQIVVELLIAAALGGVIGWALHMRMKPAARPAATPAEPGVASDDAARLRIAELEAQLRTERAEAAELRKRAEARPEKAKGEADEEATLAWRNKHLEARVRFLEGKVADLETSAAPEQPPEDRNDEATRLRWRNRYLEGRIKYLEEELERTGGLTVAQVASAPVLAPASGGRQIRIKDAAPPNDADKPPVLGAPRYELGDNLRQITGIGPKIEKALHELGVWHYDQIAAWTPKEVAWMNATLGANGRIERDRWVAQASELMQRGRSASS